MKIHHINAFRHDSGPGSETRHLYIMEVNLMKPDPTRAQDPFGVRRVPIAYHDNKQSKNKTILTGIIINMAWNFLS